MVSCECVTMGRQAIVLHVSFYLAVLVAQTCFNSSWAREVLYRPKRQGGCLYDNDFTCTSGGCVGSYVVCDSIKDCDDGSDETKDACREYKKSPCERIHFQCAYGACIERKKKCDMHNDCPDGSDEEAVECRFSNSSCMYMGEEGFKCTKSDQCISYDSPCDGKFHCSDESDETPEKCLPIVCPVNSFKCTYGGCVDEKARCNGTTDCIDNSDEDPNTCPIPPGACVLPKQPEFGSYTPSVCEIDRTTPLCMNFSVQTTLPNLWLLSFKCNDGYYIDGATEDPYLIMCKNGNWSEKIPVCKKKCSPLISLSVGVKCWYEGKIVNCSKPMLPTTKAEIRCNPFYYLTNPAPYRTIECKEGGKWDNEPFHCQPDCGKINNDTNANTSDINDESTKQIVFPWHAGLYMKNKTNHWEQMCGGSLISPHIVLTAAHCIFEDTSKTVRLPEDVKVGLGKYYREWTRDEPYAIKSDVIKIRYKESYTGRDSHPQDIAVLDLMHYVHINANTMPVCVDWSPKEGTIKNKELGKVVGWGARINQIPSEALLYAELPYLDYGSCISQEEPNYQHSITADKVCANVSNGVRVAQGDSGGGFTFVKGDFVYVYGIISYDPNPHKSSVQTFTNLMYKELITWLEDAKKKLDDEHPERSIA